MAGGLKTAQTFMKEMEVNRKKLKKKLAANSGGGGAATPGKPSKSLGGVDRSGKSAGVGQKGTGPQGLKPR